MSSEYKYDRTNSKGEKIFRRDTNETLEEVEKYLDSKNILKLECHIEYLLFKSLLAGKFPWNTSLSGSTIMYKRSPNKFNIDMIFSLNFLRV